MDWEQIIDTLMELVKDEETRTDIYKTILEASDDVDDQYIEDTVHGIDDAFDNAWSLYQDDMTTASEEDDEVDVEDNDYETESDWEIDDSEEQ
jgi:hypothetical protein